MITNDLISQLTLAILNTYIHYGVNRIELWDLTLSHFSPEYNLIIYFSEIYFNIISPSTPNSANSLPISSLKYCANFPSSLACNLFFLRRYSVFNHPHISNWILRIFKILSILTYCTVSKIHLFFSALCVCYDGGIMTSVFSTGLLKMFVGMISCYSPGHLFLQINPMWFLSVGLRQGSGLCSLCSRTYPGTEGTNHNRHWNHHRWHATNSRERTRLSCWCL